VCILLILHFLLKITPIIGNPGVQIINPELSVLAASPYKETTKSPFTFETLKINFYEFLMMDFDHFTL